MTAEERRLAQQKFMSNETCVMCATTAFGMGIDKADVRLVVHWQAPKSLDAYIQASPRSHRNCYGDLHASLIAWIHLLHDMAASLIAWRPLFHHMITFFVAWNRLISSLLLIARPHLSTKITWHQKFLTACRLVYARTAFRDALDKLRDYFHSVETCRWAQIIQHLEGGEAAKEQVPSGCGKCDVCVARASGNTGERRDFSAPAVLLLWALETCLQKNNCKPHHTSDRKEGHYGVIFGSGGSEGRGIRSELGNPRGSPSLNLEKAYRDIVKLRYDSRESWATHKMARLLPQLAGCGFVMRHTYAYHPPHRKDEDVADMWSLTDKGKVWLESSGVKAKPHGWLDGLPPMLLPVPQSLRETKLCCGEAADLCKACNAAANSSLFDEDEASPQSGANPTPDALPADAVSLISADSANGELADKGSPDILRGEEGEGTNVTRVVRKRRRVVGYDEDEEVSARPCRVWEEAGAELAAKRERLPLRVRFAMLTVGVDEKEVTEELIDELSLMSAANPPDMTAAASLGHLHPSAKIGANHPVSTKGGEREGERGSGGAVVWRKHGVRAGGRGGSPHLEHSALLACKCNGLFRCVLSVCRYEVELLPSGGFQYAMHAHGKTVAHSEFGADNILKFSLPDLPKDDTTARVERLAHKALLDPGNSRSGEPALMCAPLAAFTLLGRKFVYFGFKSDHSMSDTRAFLIAERGRGPHIEWSCADEARQLLADFSQVKDPNTLTASCAKCQYKVKEMAKLGKRLEHAFSKTYRGLREFTLVDAGEAKAPISSALAYLQAQPPVPPGEARVVLMEDTRGTGVDAKGGEALMTDGNGLISLNLAMTIPQARNTVEQNFDTIMCQKLARTLLSASEFLRKADLSEWWSVHGEGGGRHTADLLAVLSTPSHIVEFGGKLVSEEPDGAPLVTQFRQWLGGSLDKGTLTTDARLPPGWIVLPHSCRKIRGSEGCAARARGVSRFEINSTFDVCSRGRTNVNLVQLLEHLAVRPQELRQKEAERVHSVNSPALSITERMKVLSSLQGGLNRRGGNDCCSAGDLLLAGFDQRKEPFLTDQLAKLEMDELRSLRGARVCLKLSHTLVGVADPTGSLPEGSVCAVVQGAAIGQSMVPKLHAHAHTLSIVGGTSDGSTVLLYRSPGCTTGDVRAVTNNCTPQLRQSAVVRASFVRQVLDGLPSSRCNALFFSTRGKRSVADELAGGDLDDPTLVGNICTTQPWRAEDRKTPLPPQKARSPVEHFLELRFNSCVTVGWCANQLLALADVHGLDHPQALELAKRLCAVHAPPLSCPGTAYYHALDGEPTQISRGKHKRLYSTWPDWMEPRANRNRELKFVRTKSIVSDLWHAPLGGSRNAAAPRTEDKLYVDPALNLSLHADECMREDFEKHVRKWKKLRKEYGRKMERLFAEEASQRGEDGELAEELMGRVREIHHAYRRILLREYEEDEEFLPLILKRTDVVVPCAEKQDAFICLNCASQPLLLEVSAMFVASYAVASQIMQSERGHSPSFAFPWRVAGDLLCELKVLRTQQQRGSSIIHHYVPHALRGLL
ncbi:MAG: hypothetical protein SGPRY_001441, partial [Prymnesium sp.]